MEYAVIHKKDNVKVCLDNGHKYAVRDIQTGEQIIKYGFPIGVALQDIKEGEHIHSHNLKTSLAGAKTGALCCTLPSGVRQLGGDLLTTQKMLWGLVKHPNAGGVLVLGLGCENNNIAEFKKVLGEYDEERVRFLNCQDFDDEIAEGIKIISELQELTKHDTRTDVSISRLKIGLKCGGSDGLSPL